jgi:hypothetical protein
MVRITDIDSHCDANCRYSHMTTPTFGRYHVRRQAEEFEATATVTTPNVATIGHIAGSALCCPTSQRRRQQQQQQQQHQHQQATLQRQPVPSVSALVAAARNSPSLPPSTATTPADDDVDSARNSRSELLFPVPVRDPSRFQPFGTMNSRGSSGLRRQQFISPLSSPVTTIDELTTFVQSGPL